MSWTVGILIVSWLCIFSVSGATLGESCIVTENCTATVEICTDGNCECKSGYFNVSDVCKSSSITVSLSAQSTSVVYGSEVVLTASITSEVPLNLSNTIKWLKGQTGGSLTEFELTPSKYTQNDVSPGQVTLTIQSVNFNDTRTYQVKVGNIAGVTSNSNQVSLTVTGEKPTVMVPETITETGTTVTINCTVSVAQGSPAYTVYWLLNGQTLEISNSAKYSGGTVNTPSLSINNIGPTDAGVYHCGAKNLLGSSNSSKSVTLEKPTVTLPGTITETDTTVTINCTVGVAQGSPTVTVYWLFNGQNVEISNSAKYSGGTWNTPSLTINNIAFKDAGVYHCGARNLLGSSNSSLSVNLAAPTVVTISKQPAGPVNYNSSVTFNGSYTSDLLSVTIKWQKMTGGNFMDIDITTDKYTGSSVTGPSPELRINPVKLIDETFYRLVVSNGVGSSSSNNISISVIGGNLTVTTGVDVIGRFGGSVTIDCTVTGPEVNKIQWMKYINNNPEDISIDGQKFSGGSLFTKALTINSLANNDALFQYQCTASNPRGVFKSATIATVTVKYGQFDEDCSNSEPCDTDKYLTCRNSKCLCMNTYYHKDQVCYPKARLAPTVISLDSTTNMFSVSWNNPTTDYELVSGYEVTWRFLGSSSNSSGQLERNVNQYTVSSHLMSGQLYTVTVISKVTLTNPADSFVQPSPDTPVRLVPSAPGPVIPSQSNFAHNNLQVKWTAPVNTVVTKYEITLNGTPYTTMNNDSGYQFTGKVFIPGHFYVISIVTVSGTTSDIVKRSLEHTEWIRTTPTKPMPPTKLRCPQSPLDVSLEISWIAPAEPNGIIRMYQINVNQGSLGQVYTLSNETHKNVEGLLPEQEYIFTVSTINDAQLTPTSDQSQPITCKTKAGVSTAPTDMEIDEIKSRGFRIEFNIPDNVKGILAAYKIVISKEGNCVQQILVQGNCSICMSTVDCPPPINYTVPNITNAVSYTASNLYPYTKYMVKVVAINGEGEGHPVNTTVTTEEEVPLQPGQISASNIKKSSLTLNWTLDTSPGNTTYTIYTYESIDATGTNFLMNKSSKVYGFDTNSLLVTGLDEFWPYKFKVNAATVKGNTTSEFSSVFRTKQGAPGQVLNLTVQKKGNDFRTAYVSWSPPALRDHNGVLQSYLFSSNHTGAKKVVQIPVLPTQATVEVNISVTPEAVYDIEVVLQNNESTKSQASMQIYRAPAGPPPVTNIEPLTTKPGEHKPTTNTITIEINTTYFKNNDNGKQVFVGVAVCAESKCKDKSVMPESTLLHNWKDLPNWHEASKDGFPLYRVTNDTFKDKVINGSRRRRSVNSGSTTELVIGEDKTCPSLNKDVYCNGQLSPGKSYIVIIFACTSGGCAYSEVDGAFSTQKVPDEEDNAMKIIIGVVVAVVVVAVIVGVAFVVVRRRNRLGETKQYTKGIDNQTTFDEPVPKNIPRKRPIKLKELSDKVAEKHKDSNLHFAREYEDLKALSPKHPAETSELDNNKLKNRYVNILPFDHSRVKLMLTEDDDPSTDFINANYLPGYKSQREYIATQGPIPGTIDDFWRMIWEQNVSIIVMLTLCKEEGRVKCEMYWPENIHEPKQYGDLVVETVSNSTVNFYEFRIFKIKLGDTTRSVKHFHFLQWKDFSANVQNDVMIDFIKNVRNHIRPPDMNGPVVVHCSAGVGRTGTYCALDHLFQFVDEHDLDESIDIFDLVMNLRERRMFMVQTEQQYIFIHDCLKDYLEKKLAKDECLYENQAFVADDEPVEESLYQNYSNQRTDL